MTAPIVFRISGKAMLTIEGSELHNNAENYDGGSKGARDALAALQGASGGRKGRGWSYVITTTREGAETIRDYCETVGAGFMYESDPETRADGRALLTVAETIRQAVLKAPNG